ncbi:unnamed protein product [Prorocentrum cordatum]|nr:unnamed protein product [Polarella glacialis]
MTAAGRGKQGKKASQAAKKAIARAAAALSGAKETICFGGGWLDRVSLVDMRVTQEDGYYAVQEEVALRDRAADGADGAAAAAGGGAPAHGGEEAFAEVEWLTGRDRPRGARAMARQACLLAALPAAGGLVAPPPRRLAATAPAHAMRRTHARDCTPADEDMHVVFSTGCNAFQHWQAEVLLNSAYHQGQCGRMTRIVVGCDKLIEGGEKVSTHQPGAGDKLIDHDDLLKSTYPALNVHVAPAIPEAAEFPWFNKPWSFEHWLNTTGDDVTERVVAILDPDEFFLQPLTQRAEHAADGPFEIIHGYPERLSQQVTDVVQPGWAVAQKYGLGSAFLSKFDQRTICPGGAASPCANITHEQGHLYQSVGPPYMLHNTDFKKVMPTWWELMKPVYAQDKGDILADMFAYTYAAVHHGVSHVQLENYMVSNSRAGGEAWRFVDSLASMSCHDPEAALEGRKRPGFLHAASHFKACTNGEHIPYEAEECPESGSDLWNFHKGHVPSTILSCDEPLITPPPDDLFNKQKGVIGKRSAFMICHLTFMVNRAALDYKAKFCASGFNANKCTRLVLGPNQRPALGNQFGYPLARVDQECNK